MNKTKKIAVFAIDMQNDFCLPMGALPVPGAMDDAKRLAEFIKINKNEIGAIVLTMDSHHPIDIAHAIFWHDKNGNPPPPFTGIATDFLQEVHEGKWTPRFFPKEAIKYLEDLKANGEFSHTIWPEHCIISSEGAAVVNVVLDAIKEWEQLGNFKTVIFKGSNPLTEHFGAFRAQIEIPNCPETQLNQDLVNLLEKYDAVYVAGEAKSHCCAVTIKQAMDLVPNLAKKFILLEDCMSAVQGCEHLADKIYDDAKAMGIKFAKSSDPIK